MIIKVLEKISSLVAREAYEANWVSPLSQRLSDFALSASRTWLSSIGRAAAIDELRAKIHAFGCFRNPDAWTQGIHFDIRNWAKCVEASHAQDPYTSMWLLEGWATRLVDCHLQTDFKFPWLSLSGAKTERLYASRLVLHTGAGMSFARFTLSQWTAAAAMPSLGAVIQEFLQIASERALPNYRACLVEPFGLVVRNLYPQLIPAISRLLSECSREEFDLFWHGSGRGLYFSPLHLVPGLPLRRWSFYEATSNAPNPIALRNLISGFFWSVTLVNIRQPEVVTRFLGSRSMKDWEVVAQAISDGVSAALLVWHHLTEDNRVTEHFLDHVPCPAPDALRRFWVDQIVSFSRLRLAHEYEHLRRDDRIADVFRYQEK